MWFGVIVDLEMFVCNLIAIQYEKRTKVSQKHSAGFRLQLLASTYHLLVKTFWGLGVYRLEVRYRLSGCFPGSLNLLLSSCPQRSSGKGPAPRRRHLLLLRDAVCGDRRRSQVSPAATKILTSQGQELLKVEL